jgi:2-oxo-4-hydroxy-4-carboxy-5-ureidoimidazoline decarboxylase
VPTLDEVNRLSPRDFSSRLRRRLRHSPWIAERALAKRPFVSREALQSALYGALQASSDDEKLALIRAHPMLAGKEADAGTLTDASAASRPRRARRAHARPEGRARDPQRALRRHVRLPVRHLCAPQSPRRDPRYAAGAPSQHARAEIANAIAQIGEIARLRVADS